MFSFPLYHIETSLDKMELISTFPLPTNQFSMWLKKLLAFFSLGIASLMVSKMECFMNVKLMQLECSYFL